MWSILASRPELARHVAVLDEEELTPKLCRSFRPWPKALFDALAELDVPTEDAHQIVALLDGEPPGAAKVPAPPPRNAAPVQQRTSDLAIHYINLASRSDRRAALEAELAPAGLSDAERLEAVTGEAAAAAVVGTHWDTTLNAKFDRNCRVNLALAMSAGERGCAASHAALWQRCVSLGAPMLVLEDDLRFRSAGIGASARSLVGAIEAGLAPHERTLLLYLGADAKIRQGAPSLRGQQACWAARAARVPCTVVEAEWAWQTHAYIIWPAAAAVLLAGLPMDAPVDVYLSRHFCAPPPRSSPFTHTASPTQHRWCRTMRSALCVLISMPCAARVRCRQMSGGSVACAVSRSSSRKSIPTTAAT